jgi:ribonuclease HII
MPIWAGIDEAGYGPTLGPLCLAAVAVRMPDVPEHGALWDMLGDAVTRTPRGAAGRVVVNDSKKVHSGPHGLRRLEAGVLGFTGAAGRDLPPTAGALHELLGMDGLDSALPWSTDIWRMELPLICHPSRIEGHASDLCEAMAGAGIEALPPRLALVQPPEFNRMVARTRNKSLLLFQKAGLLLQWLWDAAGPGRSHVVVDRHGGRMRYRRLLVDVFPHHTIDVTCEEAGRSVYRVHGGETRLDVEFVEKGDMLALPTALASMTAKYVRELHMRALSAWWAQRVPDLKPTAGYAVDARRFLAEIADAMPEAGLQREAFVRGR